jgi:hypothetical protein
MKQESANASLEGRMLFKDSGGADEVAQEGEHLPGKCTAPSSNPSTEKK